MTNEQIIKQLDIWIKQCEINSEKLNSLPFLAGNQNAMAQAYWNVKQLIEVNK